MDNDKVLRNQATLSKQFSPLFLKPGVKEIIVHHGSSDETPPHLLPMRTDMFPSSNLGYYDRFDSDLKKFKELETPTHEQLLDHDFLKNYAQDREDTDAVPVNEPGKGKNNHPGVFHVGTRQAASRRGTGALHTYRIPVEHINPEIYRDSLWIPPERDNVAANLWESFPVSPWKSMREHKVLAYRNLMEDSGNISYVVPKAGVRGAINEKHPFMEHIETKILNPELLERRRGREV